MTQENKCSCESGIGEWVFCFAVAWVFLWIGRIFYKPFEESNFLFKFLGILSIIFLLFITLLVGISAVGASPIHPVVLLLPGGIYLFLAILSIVVGRMNETNS